MGILKAAKSLGIKNNVIFRVIDKGTQKVVQEFEGHNQATNSMLTGIAHYLSGDGVLNQGNAMLDAFVPKYISLGTMGLLNQDCDERGLPTGIGVNASSDEKIRFKEYAAQAPGYGADGYDASYNNDRKDLGLGPVYAEKVTKTENIDAVNCELISPTFPRAQIAYRQILPETEAEVPETIDIIFSAMISTGALAQFRGNNDYLFITEAGLWSQPTWNKRGTGLLAGYRIMPPDESNWDMSYPENREKLRQSIIRVGKNQVVQVIWKIQIGSIGKLSNSLSSYPTDMVTVVGLEKTNVGEYAPISVELFDTVGKARDYLRSQPDSQKDKPDVMYRVIVGEDCAITEMGNSEDNFHGIKNLYSFIMSNDMREIKSYTSHEIYGCFDNCTNLTEFKFSSTLRTIGIDTFHNTALQNVSLPDSIKSIGAFAFNNCNALKTVVLSNKMTEIPLSAFKDCDALQSVILPNQLITIGARAFENCKSLVGITLPNTLESICTDAFRGCESMNSITIPVSTKTIEQGVFRNCTNLNSVYVDVNSNYFVSDEGVLMDKEKTRLLKYPSKYTFPIYTLLDTITHIDSYAFDNVTSLQSLKWKSVTNIGEYAFEGCTSLFAINEQDGYGANLSGVTTLGVGILKDCTSVYSVSIPDAVGKLGRDFFGGCTSLNRVHLGAGITDVASDDDGATFEECNNLESIEVTGSNQNLLSTSGVLYRKNRSEGSSTYTLTLIIYPPQLSTTTAQFGENSYIVLDSTTDIEMVQNCTKLKTIIIQPRVERIRADAFKNSVSITNITIMRDTDTISGSPWGASSKEIVHWNKIPF